MSHTRVTPASPLGTSHSCVPTGRGVPGSVAQGGCPTSPTPPRVLPHAPPRCPHAPSCPFGSSRRCPLLSPHTAGSPCKLTEVPHGDSTHPRAPLQVHRGVPRCPHAPTCPRGTSRRCPTAIPRFPVAPCTCTEVPPPDVSRPPSPLGSSRGCCTGFPRPPVFPCKFTGGVPHASPGIPTSPPRVPVDDHGGPPRRFHAPPCSSASSQGRPPVSSLTPVSPWKFTGVSPCTPRCVPSAPP